MSKFISIITVNYNNKHLLGDFLNSVKDLDYPQDGFEVMVVDNGSTDGSIRYIREKFSWVRLIVSKKNLGFGGGNNLGMRKARGDQFLLVNNDTVLQKNTLKTLSQAIDKSKDKTGAIAGKIVLMDSYIPITINEAYFSSYKISKSAEAVTPDPYVIPHNSNTGFRENVLIPLNYKYQDDLKLNLFIKPFRNNKFSIDIGTKKVHTGFIKSISKEHKVVISITKNQLKGVRKDLIQNSGNFYFRDGSGRDRGAVVAWHKQFYEVDKGQYNKREKIPGFCGAAVLLNKKALKQVGYFDENFFMYYEDADLSFRLRENGWSVVYDPTTIIRHVHAASSKEWSDFFLYNAERGRLIFLGKHWPRHKALVELGKYFFKNTLGSLFFNKRFDIRFRVFFSVIIPFAMGLFRINRVKGNEFKNLM